MTLKKIFLFAMFCYVNFDFHAVGIKKLDFSTKGSLSFDAGAHEKSSWSASQNASIKLAGFECRASAKIPNTLFSEEAEFFSPTFYCSLDLKESGKFFEKFPLFLSVGNLKPTGSVYRLNTPTLSGSLSPFSTFSPKAANLNAAPKTPCAEEIPLACLVKYDFSRLLKKNYKFDISLYAQNDRSAAAAFYMHIPFDGKNANSMDFSHTVGRFHFSNENSTWFSMSEYFPEDFFISFSNQLSIKTRPIKSRMIFNLYQNRNSGFDWTFSSENTFSYNGLSLSASYFYANSPSIFTSSGKNLKVRQQIFLNPQFVLQSRNGKSQFRMGACGFWEDRLDSSGKVSSRLRLSAGIEGCTDFFSARFTSSAKNISFSEENLVCTLQNATYTEELHFSFPGIKTVAADIAFSFRPFYAGREFSSELNTGFSMRFPQKNRRNIHTHTRVSATVKSSEEKTEISSLQASVNFNSKIKKTSVRFSLALKCKF